MLASRAFYETLRRLSAEAQLMGFNTVLAGDGFDRARKLTYGEPLELNLPAPVVDVDSE